MNQRISTIIHMLNSAQAPVSIAELSGRFQVSQRTIRNDLKEIGSLLRENGLPDLSIQSGGQIVPPEDFDQLLHTLMPGDFYTYKLSKEERVWAAAAMLVSAPAFVTLAEIAESLFVSRATIINDLDQIRELIEKGGLELASRANKGLLVEGKESAKRYFLMRMFQGGLSSGGQAAVSHVSVQAGDRTRLQKIVSEQEHLHQSFLTDASFQDILLYLGIMIDRNTKGELLESQPRQSGERFRMAQDILRYVTQYCTVLTTEEDIYFLSNLLERARYLRKTSFEKDALKIQMLTRQFIASVSDELDRPEQRLRLF